MGGMEAFNVKQLKEHVFDLYLTDKNLLVILIFL
jgi:hypothetical protein